jgi:UPF0288 family protein (methanogenesis marker protein 3)
MDKTISQLSEIEEKANQIINRANDQKEKLHDEYEIKIAQMEESIASENTAKLEHLQEQMNKELAKEKELMIRNSEQQLKALGEIDQKAHKVLAHQVFEHIMNS